jgi:hypothetical protein
MRSYMLDAHESNFGALPPLSTLPPGAIVFQTVIADNTLQTKL